MVPRFFYQKGHGVAPLYFSLDKTLLWLCKSLEISDFTRTGSRLESAKAKWTKRDTTSHSA
jgi:hypothetical protein